MTAERQTPEEVTIRVGALGDSTFQVSRNSAGLYTIVLKGNAPDNVFLSQLADARVIFDMQIVARQAYQELAQAAKCMVGTRPGIIGDVVETSRTWVIVAADLILNRKDL